MSPIEITCSPADGILRVSADTIAALDRLAHHMPDDQPWQIDAAIGWTAADTIHLTAKPAIHQPEDNAA